ncbi:MULTISPECIES: ABC transporter ATP-binding protein [unclassified Enterococcus]|uniref:ATP-binding cassette domain-containing protein n=1 Tax=unclassified Enterococcus TaxID=2608891 RepID=UPI0015559753|nr:MULTISPECIES: ABC transporter ATP-binding protein [unclassified Enterococcus]MBS7578084.1 ABC transporter ATP-binding protein [Enterococcus sp. MMGLQ5-2]MBS7585344.1 ABC transporter ATP-binding protein [Enterococcus sp. MMGLQ5-1]NPD13201.1 ABC transporter ATP-binding protein [Enterococcus sp. MMGLQ5-1]NPD37915.1 ABC transporter ATP-binding protein [Enterococcus sp. MMGLQ5-2]
MSLAVQNIQKSYRKQQILKDIRVDFKPETIYGLLGRNGAGKSTLLNVISARIFANEGCVTLDGQNLIENETLQNRIFLMSEDNLYTKSLKVKEIFKITESFYGDFDWDLANRLTTAFQLKQKLSFRKLSTGYRSILKLIVALSVPADYIFLDEPVLGLDANHRDLFYRTLIETYSERPRTFVISTHLIEEIAKLIEEVVIIESGQIIEQVSAEAIKTSNVKISGAKDMVTQFTNGMDIIGQDELGGLVTYYVKDYPLQNVPDGLTVSPLNLQDYFVQITKRKGTY